MNIFHNLQGSKLNIKKQFMDRRWYFIKRIFFILCIAFILCLAGYHIFLPLYTSEHIIIDYGINDFDICIEQPIIWKYCKYWFAFTYLFASLFFSNTIAHFLFQKNFHINKSSHKKNNIKDLKPKKEKVSYSFIDPKPLNINLNLLIRWRWKNKRINLFTRKKFISKYFNYWNYWNRKN